MRNYVSALLGILLFTIGGCAPDNNSDAEKSGIESAQSWLEFVDSEKYAESWEEAAEYFKSAITKEKWGKTIQAVRNPLGKVVSRKLKSQKYTTSLPGAPDGSMSSFNIILPSRTRKPLLRQSHPCWTKTVSGKCRVTISNSCA